MIFMVARQFGMTPGEVVYKFSTAELYFAFTAMGVASKKGVFL